MRKDACKNGVRVVIDHKYDGMGGLGGGHGVIVDIRNGSWVGDVRVHLDDNVKWDSREPWFPHDHLTPERLGNPDLDTAKQLLDEILGGTRFVVTGGIDD